VVLPSPLEQLGLSGTAIGLLRISVENKQEENTKPRKMYYCGGAEESKGGDDNAAAALLHAVAPVVVPSLYWRGDERRVYCCGGAEESKEGDGENEKDGDAAAALPHAVVHVRAPSAHSRGGVEERKECNGDAAATFSHAVAPVGAPSAAAGLYGEWRGYSQLFCCVELRRFRKDQVTRRDSVAKRATFDNWRLVAEQ
jgi:hypothetical protein